MFDGPRPIAEVMTAPMAPTRRFLVSLLAASGLLFAACGGDAADTELATIDDGSSTAIDADRTLDGAELDEAEADGPIDLNIMGDDAHDGPIPEAVAPPAPSASASPAERQRLQELGLVEDTAPAMPAIPGASAGDTGDGDSAEAAVDAAPTQTPRADLDQFPTDIPAIVPGAPSGPTSPNASLFGADAPSFGSGETSSDSGGFVIVDAEAELGLSGGDNAVTVPDAIVSSGDDVVVEGLALETAEQCEAGGPCTDLALMSGDGVGDAAGSGGVGGEVSVDADADSVDDHCEARPYDRGCPLPVVDAGGPAFGDEGEDEDVQDARQGEGEGVDVPQDVIDALLAPVDNEGDGSEDAPNADGGDAPQPDGGTGGEVDADGSAD